MLLDRIRGPLLWLGAPLALAGAVAGSDELRDGGAIAFAAGVVLVLARRVRGHWHARALPPAQTGLVSASAGASTVPGEMPGAVEASASSIAAAVRDQLDAKRLVPAAASIWAVTISGDESAVAVRGSDGSDGTAPGGNALDAGAIVEIGSVSKVFTGLLLADLAGAGVVALDDPLDRHLPGLPARVGAITLLDLTTHTAGLPRLPGSLLLAAFTSPTDPYARWEGVRVERSLRHVRVRSNRRFRYSNLGVGLLGHVLSRAAGSDYETLLRERICAPLGLTSTSVALTPVQGHDRAGLPVPPWHLAALAGAGGIRSTARDIERFLRAQLDPAATPLAQALERSQQPRRAAGRIAREQIALGWMVRAATADHGEIHWHDGGTGGFGSFVAFERDTGCGVALLQSATHSLGTDAAGARLLDRLRDDRRRRTA
ncbi:serine hydrolase domain-containing protein [Conexibacter stalactiti]|uniref:Serine hydrolase domain-containing protein n=1 Tax=Conexibacter stalactiti TaxID=1940611 RepID=A0ABU4HZE8_9ACTN|nr:serine hydrolase domain-containing protein [Conexibacter stalactiti]MDW5598660.1 serine hydrolase domain-containing protein [Conexibacter stalactiti]MEC5039302.1 serine hydrolase domain-containing protein [Conexibacter stalactiti]